MCSAALAKPCISAWPSSEWFARFAELGQGGLQAHKIQPEWIASSANICRVELYLDDCDLDRTGLLSVADFISKKRTLQKLLLNGSAINDLDAAKALASALETHPHIDEVCLVGCDLGNNLDALDEMLVGCKNCSSLLLNDNQIDSSGFARIANFLATNQFLAKLRLIDNLLSDADADSVMSALAMNTYLLKLELKNNRMTDIGRKAVEKAVFDTASLNSIAGSNHYCKIELGSTMDEGDRLAEVGQINCSSMTRKDKIWCKIFSALYRCR